jgi:phage/plasmid primase-like uncharacterized protein
MSNQSTHKVYASLAGAIRNPTGQSLEEFRAEVSRVWEAAGHVRHDHAHLTMNRVHAFAARQTDSRLVVPLSDTDSALCALLTIESSGRAEFVGDFSRPGVRVAILPEPTCANQPIVVCVDWLEGCAVRSATGSGVLCTLTPENAAHVVRQARESHPDRPLMVCDGTAPGLPSPISSAAEKAQATIIRPRLTLVDEADSLHTLGLRWGSGALRNLLTEAINHASAGVNESHRPEADQRSKLERGKSLLEGALQPSCLTQQLKTSAEAAGLSWRTIQQARSELVSQGIAIRAEKDGAAGWRWIRGDEPQSAQLRS